MGNDACDGCRPQRDRIAAGWVARGTPNPVVLTGDVHRHWAADLLQNPFDPRSAHIGVELVTTSVSSGGRRASDGPSDLPANLPHINYPRDRHSYVRCTLTTDQLAAEFMELSDTMVPDFGNVSVSAGARFVVRAGRRRPVAG